MFGRIHQWLPALGFLGVASVWAEPGYLPQIGPMALRFRVPPQGVVDYPRALPPPPAPLILPAPTMPIAPPAETSNAAPTAIVMPVIPTNGPPLEFNAREPMNDFAPIAAPNGVVSPQMLIKYFTTQPNPGTNAPGTGATTPVGFNPPPVTLPTPAMPAPTKPTNPTKP
jgi:hypothetical protein